MKKMMIAAALVLTAGVFTACNGEGCYKVTTKTGNTESVAYVYGNSEDVDLVIEKAEAAAKLIGVDFSASRMKVAKNEEDCKAANK